jgi:hypothetical protein
MSDHQEPQHARPGEDDGPAAPPRPLQRIDFTPAALRAQVRNDLLMRAGLLAVVIGSGGYLLMTADTADFWASMAILAVLIVWLAINSISARASRELPTITALLDTDFALAEDAIAANLARRPLMRWVRLMLYHRLATLRHRQQRFEDSARICETVLAYRLGPAVTVKPHLLLMLTEARLHLDFPAAAYEPLRALHGMDLGLAETLQRLALQTRYEVTIGRHDYAVHDAQRKLSLAELMPAPQCGAMNALLATAADATDQPDLAGRLWARAELLLTPAQFRHITSGGFGVTIAAAPPVGPT